MQITTSEEQGITLVNVSGRMDAVTTGEFEAECKALVQNGKVKLLFNLQGLEYISSAGLRGILGILKLAKAQGGTIAFCALQDMVVEVFRISGFTSMLSIYSQKDEAILAMTA